MSDNETRLSELEDKIAALADQNERLLGLLEGGHANGNGHTGDDAATATVVAVETEESDADRPSSDGVGLDRRSALRGLGTAAAAAVGLVAANGAVRPSPAAAANGDPIIIGTTNFGTSRTFLGTSVAGSGTASSTPAAFGAGNLANPSSGERAIALLGWAEAGTGVQGEATEDSGVAVRGTSDSANRLGREGEVVGTTTGGDAAGVRGRVTGAGAGVLGEAASGFGVRGTASGGRGVFGRAASGVGVFGETTGGGTTPGTGMRAHAANNSTALRATADEGPAIRAASDSGAALRLDASSLTMPPSSGTWQAGSFVFSGGALWLCLASGSGTDAEWIRLSTTFVPLAAPVRLYDSRPGEGPEGNTRGRISRNETRDLDMTVTDDIPSTASAVLLNATVAATQGPGFLTLYPQGASRPVTSSVNYADGAIVGNNATVGLNAGQLTAFIGGGGSTDSAHVILDAYGYYA